MNFYKVFERPFPLFHPFPGPQSPVEEWLDTGSMDRVHETPFDKGFDRSISPFRPFLFLVLPVKMLDRGPLTGQFSLSKPCQPTWVHAPGGPVSSVNEGSQIHSGLPGPYFSKCSKFPLKPISLLGRLGFAVTFLHQGGALCTLWVGSSKGSPVVAGVTGFSPPLRLGRATMHIVVGAMCTMQLAI